MSIVIPFLAFLLAGAFAAYHRLRLAYWAAITDPDALSAIRLTLLAAVISLPLAGNFSDIDGDALSYTASGLPPSMR